MEQSIAPAIHGSTATAAAVRALLVEGRAPLEDFAAGIGKSVQTVRLYVRQGLPVDYIGSTPYIRVVPGLEWLRNRRRRNLEPRRPGRPKKQNATA
jgi:hypothetical protein